MSAIGYYTTSTSFNPISPVNSNNFCSFLTSLSCFLISFWGSEEALVTFSAFSLPFVLEFTVLFFVWFEPYPAYPCWRILNNITKFNNYPNRLTPTHSFLKNFTIGKLSLERPNIQCKNSYPHFITAPFIYPHPHPPFAYPHWPTHPPPYPKSIDKITYFYPFLK